MATRKHAMIFFEKARYLAKLYFLICNKRLGAVYKGRPHSERRVLQMWTSTLFWGKKLRIFRNLWCVRTVKGGWASADIFRTRGRGQFFAILYGRPLCTATYTVHFVKKYCQIWRSKHPINSKIRD